MRALFKRRRYAIAGYFISRALVARVEIGLGYAFAVPRLPQCIGEASDGLTVGPSRPIPEAIRRASF